MKKLFCLLLAFCALHTIIAQGWEQTTLKDKWGDDSGIGYYQGQLGNDSKNNYDCLFGFEVMDDVLYFAFASKIAGDFAIHPGYDIFGGKKVTIQFRKDGAIQTFSGKTTVYDGSNASCTAFVGEAAVSIAKLLKGNGTWDVLVECSNWYVRTKVTGNLPLSFDEKDMLILSADGKTVTGVKPQYKNSLESVVIPNGVTSIGGRAFKDCEKLKTVTLPDSVTEIGDMAFSYCHALREVSLPKRLTKINEMAFLGCNSLQTIKIPDSVTEIEHGAFVECYGLREVSLPQHLTKIGSVAFSSCSSLQTIKIPDSVTEIGKSAFLLCNALREVSLPKHLTKIDNSTFSECKSLQTIKIPDSVTEIGLDAFSGCSSLREISLPSRLTKIGYCAFDDCPTLKNLQSSVCSIQNGFVIHNNAINSVLDVSLESYTVPAKIEVIDFEDVFGRCYNLKSITVPKTVKLTNVPRTVQVIRN